ncbi:MAG: bifunctional oligoribonuclease/PAP phosphatase NrnA [Clostridia bacterium]
MKINLKELAKFENIAIATHTRPDGDAVGSSVGLYYGLKQLGNEPDLLCDMEIPKKMRFLYGMDKFKTVAKPHYDVVIFSDCADVSRVGNLGLDLRKTKVVCIDHHETSNKNCDISLIVPSSASTCELVLEILEENDIAIPFEIADVLYTGLMTDTGNFAHTNVKEDTFLHASRLVKYGANPNLLSRRIFKLMEGDKYKLLANILTNLKLFDDGKVAFFYVSKQLLSDLNLSASATEGLIDNALSIENVQIAIAVLQADEKTFKVSFRSIEGIDVNKVAENFGGGGHKQAAGCTLCGFYEDVVDKLVRQSSLYTV